MTRELNSIACHAKCAGKNSLMHSCYPSEHYFTTDVEGTPHEVCSRISLEQLPTETTPMERIESGRVLNINKRRKEMSGALLLSCFKMNSPANHL